MTLLYGLTSAPAAQPRNALYGQVIASTIGLAFSYANVATWIRTSLAPACAISVMVKLGITHPPAGASAFAFAAGGFAWTALVFLLVCNVVAISAATFINNLSQRRQYPTYWGLHTIRVFWDNLMLEMEGKKAKGKQLPK